ncbi:uncharacterized protein LOC129456350 isoform X1 [Periophthalmus magnuspinnatus]|uniref:uncharacterized protein LOC129456350 isoform X1 n=1 Tax=Periophthalmus magnuspinnatus TaxID=409849 RepID=UPI002436435D|nr:uncharacterized protein LOC129456350 isoform X1 [Periophthalmus magnuspinnatus]
MSNKKGDCLYFSPHYTRDSPLEIKLRPCFCKINIHVYEPYIPSRLIATHVLYLIFHSFLSADVTSAPSVQTLTAIEGGNVTFWSGLSKQTHAILSYGNVTLLNFHNGETLKKKSKICVENGTIIMTNIHQNDSNHIYKLQIVGLEVETYNYKLNVTKCQLQVSDYTSVPPTQHPSTQEKTDHTTVALIIVGLVVVVVVVVVGWIIYCKREKLRKRDLWKVIFRKQSTNLTNGNYHGSTSHRVETLK